MQLIDYTLRVTGLKAVVTHLPNISCAVSDAMNTARNRALRYESHVTRHTSHVTRHTSHVTRHTSHVTRHTSNVTRHTSHVTTSSRVTCHTSSFRSPSPPPQSACSPPQRRSNNSSPQRKQCLHYQLDSIHDVGYNLKAVVYRLPAKRGK
jgi:hypothetical protein